MYDAPDANSLSLLFPSSIPFQLAFFCIQVQRSAGQFADYHSFFSFFSFNPVYNTLSFFLCYVFHIPTLKIFVASHSKDEYLVWFGIGDIPILLFFSFSFHLIHVFLPSNFALKVSAFGTKLLVQVVYVRLPYIS